MSKTTKTAAVNPAKRRKPPKAQFITRAEARRRAARHVLNRIFKGSTVLAGEDARLRLYFRGRWTAKDVWVVYQNCRGMGFQSSDVVVVCKRTGRVLYEGSANDEG